MLQATRIGDYQDDTLLMYKIVAEVPPTIILADGFRKDSRAHFLTSR